MQRLIDLVSGCIGIVQTINSQQPTVNSQQSTVNSQQSTSPDGATGIDMTNKKPGFWKKPGFLK
ncbi:MAG: hypothetical protein WCD53_10840 [Microcoleus sp.]